jgi:hypothetical protein
MQLKHVAQFMLGKPLKMAAKVMTIAWDFSETAAKVLLNRVVGQCQKSMKTTANPVQP